MLKLSRLVHLLIGGAVPLLALWGWGYPGVGWSFGFVVAMWGRELATRWTGGWHPWGDVVDQVAWTVGWSAGAMIAIA